MKDYAQYSSRIPSPGYRRAAASSLPSSSSPSSAVPSPSPRSNTVTTTTRHVSRHPLSGTGKQSPSKQQQLRRHQQQQQQHHHQESNNSASTVSTAGSSSVVVPSNSSGGVGNTTPRGGNLNGRNRTNHNNHTTTTPKSTASSSFPFQRARNGQTITPPANSSRAYSTNETPTNTSLKTPSPSSKSVATTPNSNTNSNNSNGQRNSNNPNNTNNSGSFYMNVIGKNRRHGTNNNSNNTTPTNASSTHSPSRVVAQPSPSQVVSSRLASSPSRSGPSTTSPSRNGNGGSMQSRNIPSMNPNNYDDYDSQMNPTSSNNSFDSSVNQGSPQRQQHQQQRQQYEHQSPQQPQQQQQQQQNQQQQQQYYQQQAPIPPNNIAAADALSANREGPDHTISKLRSALDEAQSKDTTAKSALAKSDAVILELRTTIRQLKRQLEDVQQDRHQVQQDESQKAQHLTNTIQNLRSQLKKEEQSQANNEQVGELQVQLDRAHAQILTADMIRKELEDTLEAEQYTWELRVQDQERTILQLQNDSRQFKDDLETCRSQWKEAEVGWNKQIDEYQTQLRQARTRLAATSASQTQDRDDLYQKISSLEHERAELQNCLDEALKELEAVDAELQNDGKKVAVEPLQQLLRWIVHEHVDENDSKQEQYQQQIHPNNISDDPKELVEQLQDCLETVLDDSNNNTHLLGDAQQQELTTLQEEAEMYKQELKAREESSAELRESLKEAVALLKPLQDAVGKAELEKSKLEGHIQSMQSQHRKEAQEKQHREARIGELEEQMESLQQQLEESQQLAQAREKLLAISPTSPVAARGAILPQNDNITKLQRKREELRRKRETENNLQQMLRDAQNRFSSMHQQNEDMATTNRELRGRLQDAPGAAGVGSASEVYQEELEKRSREIQALRQELEQTGAMRPQSLESVQADLQQLKTMQHRVHELDRQLNETRGQLSKKEHSEKILNKSLKEALGLLKPLQMHLEEAEREKLKISKELRSLRKQVRKTDPHQGDDQSRSTYGGAQDPSREFHKLRDEMEETIRQLELENSQLHDQIEDMNAGDNNSLASKQQDGGNKLRQKFIELNSRYEVTQNKLEDANVENHSLMKALRKRGQDERSRDEEMRRLLEKNERVESELQNAKAIARSALVKVEELTMANIETTSSLVDKTIDINDPIIT